MRPTFAQCWLGSWVPVDFIVPVSVKNDDKCLPRYKFLSLSANGSASQVVFRNKLCYFY